eukprot:COSAG01_NODE_69121_length_262_cov_0.638037_1_plen_67_part_10
MVFQAGLLKMVREKFLVGRQLSEVSPGWPAPSGRQRYCPVMRTPDTVANWIAPGMKGDDGPRCTTPL